MTDTLLRAISATTGRGMLSTRAIPLPEMLVERTMVAHPGAPHVTSQTDPVVANRSRITQEADADGPRCCRCGRRRVGRVQRVAAPAGERPEVAGRAVRVQRSHRRPV